MGLDMREIGGVHSGSAELCISGAPAARSAFGYSRVVAAVVASSCQTGTWRRLPLQVFVCWLGTRLHAHALLGSGMSQF
jgi:hypothetical protein